jgi:hypothetical protein
MEEEVAAQMVDYEHCASGSLELSMKECYLQDQQQTAPRQFLLHCPGVYEVR